MMRRLALAGLVLSALAAPARGEPAGLAELLELVTLVAGRAPDAAARDTIAAASAAAQERDPAGQARARREIAAFLAGLRDADPVRRAQLRIHARATICFDWDNPDGAVARREAFVLDPVIAADPRNRLVVTEDEVTALLAANARAGEIVGIAPPVPDHRALIMDLARAFPTWPAERQRGFALASLRLAMLDRAWRAATAAEREAVARQTRQRVRQPPEVPLLARALEAAAATGRPLSGFGRAAVPPLPRIGEQLGIISGMSGALRSFNP